MAGYEKRLEDLGIKLKTRGSKGKGYIPVRRAGDLLFLSGHRCELEDGTPIYSGKLGQDVTVEQGYEAARQVGINLLSTLKDHLGGLDRIVKIVKVLGFVACVPDFHQQPAVMHGFST